MELELSGLRAIVTGGASGIGAATARLLAERGCAVAVLDLNPESAPEGTLGISCDISDTASVDTAVAGAIDRLGGLDILVNNAGIGAAGDVTTNDDAEWNRVFGINVLGMVRVSRAAIPALRQSRSAAIVNTSSIAATAGLPQRALYSASKGAVSALTRAMAADHLPEGIRVNAVAPGPIWTPLNPSGGASPEKLKTFGEKTPMGRPGQPNEVAPAFLFLACEDASYMSGQVLHPNGGTIVNG